MKIAAVIPTKNRIIDLCLAVGSITKQTRLPDILVVIDQSDSDAGVDAVENLIQQAPKIKLQYVWDRKISGLVAAKAESIPHCACDIVCFLEDDVILEPDYFKQMELGFESNTNMVGCCGIVTNPPALPVAYKQFFHLFHRGIFADKRIDAHADNGVKPTHMVESDKLSGGISAWRREVFEKVAFDVENGFHLLEDIEFSTRVARFYGTRFALCINPLVRLEHNFSPINREFLGYRQKRKIAEYILYYRKRRQWQGATFSICWLMIGLFLEALYQSASARSISVISGFFVGLREGVTKKMSSPLA